MNTNIQECKKFPNFMEPPQNSTRHVVNIRKFHSENPKVLGSSIKYLVAETTWRTGLVHPWSLSIRTWQRWLCLILFVSRIQFVEILYRTHFLSQSESTSRVISGFHLSVNKVVALLCCCAVLIGLGRTECSETSTAIYRSTQCTSCPLNLPL
jgi:hypothetical protein